MVVTLDVSDVTINSQADKELIIAFNDNIWPVDDSE